MADQNIAASAKESAGSGGRGRLPLGNGLSQPATARIGKYEVLAERGHGATVRVFHAFDRDTGRPVTLKVLANVVDRPLTERFRREVASAANLRTASMIAIYELGEHVGLPFAAMERLGDDDLARAIRTRQPPTLLQKMLIMWKVAEGLQAAHASGLPYVGIRPSGIALGSDGRATIQDFGIVRLTPDEQDEASLYASPEEFTPGFEPDQLCDIFGFGVVYFELLTGTHPFQKGNSSDAGVGLLRHEPPPLRQLAPECPEELELLVCRALEKQRELRYQSLDELQEDAEPILSELKRGRAAALLADGCRWMDAEELEKAQGALRELLELDPVNQKVQRLRTAVRDALQRRAVQTRVEELLHEADQEAADWRLTRAVEILKSASRLNGSNPQVKSRLEELRARLEQRERSAQLVVEARQLLDHRDLLAARGKAMDALELDMQSTEASELLALICETIGRREREARFEEELAKAKSLLLLESFDGAIAILAALRADYPDSTVVEHWLERVETEKWKAARQACIREELAKARSLQAERQFERALALLEALSEEWPEEQEVSDLVARARHEMEQARASAQAIQKAQWLLEQDRPDLACQFLREKCAQLPEQPDLMRRLADVEEMLPAWQDRRLIQDVLSQAAALEQLHQWPVALTLLEEALRTSPDSGELLETAERLRSRLSEEERRKKLARRLETIRQKIAAQLWSHALPLIESAQKEFPGEPELLELLDDAQRGLRRSECESLVAEVRQCLADGVAEQAEEMFQKGLQRLGEESALLALGLELEADRKYREEWRSAQVLFVRRRFQEAEEILVRLAAQNRPEVRALLEMVRDARAESGEYQFRNRGREKALKLIEQQQFEQAADLIRNLLSLFPDDPILKRDLESALGGRDLQPLQPVPPPTEAIGETEPSAAPAEPRARRAAFRIPVKVPVNLRSAAGMAAVCLLIATSAVVWKSSQGEPALVQHAAKPAAPQVSVAIGTGLPGATPEAPAPEQVPAPAPAAPSVVPDAGKPQASTSPAAPRRTFSLPFLTKGGAVQPQVIPPPPEAIPVASKTQVPAFLASVVESDNAPAPPAIGVQDAGQRIVGDSGTRPGGREPRFSGVQPPKPISTPAPVLPRLASQRGVYGLVSLEAAVAKGGVVTKVTVLRGDPILAAAARSAVLKWRYQPAMLNGQPIESTVEIRVNFASPR